MRMLVQEGTFLGNVGGRHGRPGGVVAAVDLGGRGPDGGAFRGGGGARSAVRHLLRVEAAAAGWRWLHAVAPGVDPVVAPFSKVTRSALALPATFET